jgi:hypothetical protein
MQRSRRTSWVLIGSTIALGLVLSACGTRPAPGLTASYTVTSHTVTSRGGPPHGSRAASLALGRKMVRQLRRPPGSRAARQPHPLPKYLRQAAEGIGAIHRVDVARYYTAPRSMRATYAYLRKHVPAGYRRWVTGSAGQGSVTVMEFVVYAPKKLPRGVAVANLVVGVVPGRHGGSVLRADGEVGWFPPRSAAEYLRPAAYRAVTISRTTQSTGHRTSKTFRSRDAIARLARILNSLPASDGGPISCSPTAPVYHLVFRPRAGHPRFAVTAIDCVTDQVVVAGRVQPELNDPRNRVEAVAQRLLRRGSV